MVGKSSHERMRAFGATRVSKATESGAVMSWDLPPAASMQLHKFWYYNGEVEIAISTGKSH